jgi:acid phosphatase family membrane protein YuiD
MRDETRSRRRRCLAGVALVLALAFAPSKSHGIDTIVAGIALVLAVLLVIDSLRRVRRL